MIAVGLRPQLFAVCQDEEFARVLGLPVRAYAMLIAVMAAVTVTVAMRTVGLLLVSALMVVPVATAQQLTRGFRATWRSRWPSVCCRRSPVSSSPSTSMSHRAPASW